MQDLDNSKIVFNVYDKNTFIIRNSHIGKIELDWTNIYFRRLVSPHADSIKSTEAGSPLVTLAKKTQALLGFS